MFLFFLRSWGNSSNQQVGGKETEENLLHKHPDRLLKPISFVLIRIWSEHSGGSGISGLRTIFPHFFLTLRVVTKPDHRCFNWVDVWEALGHRGHWRRVLGLCLDSSLLDGHVLLFSVISWVPPPWLQPVWRRRHTVMIFRCFAPFQVTAVVATFQCLTGSDNTPKIVSMNLL